MRMSHIVHTLGRAANEEGLSLKDSAHYLLEECRMVLPGVQALFGFQLIAVFNQRFTTALSQDEQKLHLFSLALVAIAAALVMAPAAYHREVEHDRVSKRFLRLSSHLLLVGMSSLAVGIWFDFYLIANVILVNAMMSFVFSAVLFIIIISLWLIFPWSRNRKKYR